MAEVLGRLGAEHVLVVSADDGLDEISLAAPTSVAVWQGRRVSENTSSTRRILACERRSLAGLEVDGAEDSLALIRAALGGARATRPGAPRT